jgi:arginine-tRNA-protein transferase
MTGQIQKLGFYVTPPHDCSYFADRKAITLFADPRFPKTSRLYSTLANYGFRRSGKHLYQPHCAACKACIPVRVPVNEFTPKRSQRRTWRRNQDLTVDVMHADYKDKHFQLYQRYLSARHPGGGMDNPTPENYMDFLLADWVNTFFYEIKLADQLLAIAVVDQLEDGLSAVYTFFDPDYSNRGLGTYAILVEIEEAKNLGLEWLYLGYWIDECKKMKYKEEYRPVEYFIRGNWQRCTHKNSTVPALTEHDFNVL